MQKLTLTGLSSGIHTVVFTGQSANYALTLCGITCYPTGTGALGLKSARAGVSGAPAWRWVSSGSYPVPPVAVLGGKSPLSGQAFGTLGFPTMPHLAVIEYAINDCGTVYARGSGAYAYAMAEIIHALRRGVDACSILLVVAPNPSQNMSDITSNWFPYAEHYHLFANAARSLGQTFNCAVYNAHAQFGENVVANGYMAQAQPHPAQAGHTLMFNTIKGVL
jgi:hypothetical protein